MIEIETPRLRIIPLSADLMRKLLSGTPALEKALALAPSGLELDAHTHEAMEYLAGLAEKTPFSFPWITNWQIVWKDRNVSIGSACFMSCPDTCGNVEIGYGIYPEFQNAGFMTEALESIVQWAFCLPSGPLRISAECEPDNIPSQRVLEKNGFVRTGERNYLRSRSQEC